MVAYELAVFTRERGGGGGGGGGGDDCEQDQSPRVIEVYKYLKNAKGDHEMVGM
jgi:hypothetical protein